MLILISRVITVSMILIAFQGCILVISIHFVTSAEAWSVQGSNFKEMMKIIYLFQVSGYKEQTQKIELKLYVIELVPVMT